MHEELKSVTVTMPVAMLKTRELGNGAVLNNDGVKAQVVWTGDMPDWVSELTVRCLTAFYQPDAQHDPKVRILGIRDAGTPLSLPDSTKK
jgi:hypothetical protein